MKVYHPRSDFTIFEDFFTEVDAKFWLSTILMDGEDSLKGFHHPDLKPNRFHRRPKYPVKKFMCYGLYWNPLDYSYYQCIPSTKIRPFDIPSKIFSLCSDVLSKYLSFHSSLSQFDLHGFTPQSVMVNYYTRDSRMGLHVDKDEEDKESPIIGLSFGSTCKFIFEGESGLEDIRIPGNSVYVFGGSARLMKHGVGTLYSGTLSKGSEKYLSNKERLNLTIRQVYRGA